MRTVTLYTREGCHLCEDVLSVMESVRAETPFELNVVDIDTDPALKTAYGTEIPVVLVDGRKAFKYRMDAASFRARLARSTP